MDYLPPGRVVRVGDLRWRRWVIKDGLGQHWAGQERRWRDKPSEAVLFCRELEAIAERNRHCLGGDVGETFVAHIAIVTHTGHWSRKKLARFLKRHREFFIAGCGILFEILPESLKKVKR
jgi:hypothetical protein